MTQQPNCPVILEAQDILTCQQEISRKLRHFKSSMERCRRCPLEGSCEGLTMVTKAIDQAIREVSEELGI